MREDQCIVGRNERITKLSGVQQRIEKKDRRFEAAWMTLSSGATILDLHFRCLLHRRHLIRDERGESLVDAQDHHIAGSMDVKDYLARKILLAALHKEFHEHHPELAGFGAMLQLPM